MARKRAGVQALYVTRNSSAERAGIKPGDTLLAINDVPVHRAVEVVKRLWAVGVLVAGALPSSRRGQAFQTMLYRRAGTEPLGIENYLRGRRAAVTCFIGLFIFARRWNANGQCTFISFAWCRSSFAHSTTPAS